MAKEVIEHYIDVHVSSPLVADEMGRWRCKTCGALVSWDRRKYKKKGEE